LHRLWEKVSQLSRVCDKKKIGFSLREKETLRDKKAAESRKILLAFTPKSIIGKYSVCLKMRPTQDLNV